MFQRILVPVDGSHASNRGLDEAIKLAAGQPATLCLLHVVDDFVATQGMDMVMYAGGAYSDEIVQSLRKGGKQLLAKSEAKARKVGVNVETLLLETVGHRVAEIILKQAKKLHADLIVMGTHGRRGVARLVMGSDAEGVVHGALVPVLLVRSPKDPRRRGKRTTG